MKRNYSYLIALVVILLTGAFSSCTSENSTEENDKKTLTTTDTTETTQIVEKSPLHGIDISRHQNTEIDRITAVDSLSFIICKATEGVTYTDPDFKNNWEKIAEKGYIRGAYHFYHTDDDPIQQADAFISAAKFEDTDLPPVIDFEGGSLNKAKSKRLAVEKVQADLLTCLEHIEKVTGRKPMIYTNGGTGNVYLNKAEFAAYPLWVANYPKAGSKRNHPEMPGAWKETKWLFWQKSQSYKIGQTTNDFDKFNGTISELKEFIKNGK